VQRGEALLSVSRGLGTFVTKRPEGAFSGAYARSFRAAFEELFNGCESLFATAESTAELSRRPATGSCSWGNASLRLRGLCGGLAPIKACSVPASRNIVAHENILCFVSFDCLHKPAASWATGSCDSTLIWPLRCRAGTCRPHSRLLLYTRQNVKLRTFRCFVFVVFGVTYCWGGGGHRWRIWNISVRSTYLLIRQGQHHWRSVQSCPRMHSACFSRHAARQCTDRISEVLWYFRVFSIHVTCKSDRPDMAPSRFRLCLSALDTRGERCRPSCRCRQPFCVVQYRKGSCCLWHGVTLHAVTLQILPLDLNFDSGECENLPTCVQLECFLKRGIFICSSCLPGRVWFRKLSYVYFSIRGDVRTAPSFGVVAAALQS
jgi:hypothetical protein